jgi:hypothetical protein
MHPSMGLLNRIESPSDVYTSMRYNRLTVEYFKYFKFFRASEHRCLCTISILFSSKSNPASISLVTTLTIHETMAILFKYSTCLNTASKQYFGYISAFCLSTKEDAYHQRDCDSLKVSCVFRDKLSLNTLFIRTKPIHAIRIAEQCIHFTQNWVHTSGDLFDFELRYMIPHTGGDKPFFDVTTRLTCHHRTTKLPLNKIHSVATLRYSEI